MKPRRLVIEGLRSHRDRTEIDFTDVSLFAIVGDTGSGKSSILEAIVYALYASATWTRQPGELISDGKKTMTVELTFEVDGRVWIVRRSMSRGGYPPPIHLLTAADDPSIRFDLAAGVDAEVERLLGLSLDAFCSAVILPQGRFERLLTATPADRTRILKGIFRLERLDEARDLAKTLVERFRPPFEDLRRARAALLPDPAASATAARSSVAAADAILASMNNLLKEVDERGEEADSWTKEKATLLTESTALLRARETVNFGEGDRLAAIAASLEAELLPLVDAATVAAANEELAAAALQAARQSGLDPVHLASYRRVLQLARSRLPQLAERSGRLELERLSIQSDTEQLSKDSTSLEALAAAAAEAARSAAAAQAAAEKARGDLVATRAAVVEWEAASQLRKERRALAETHVGEASASRAAAAAAADRAAEALRQRESTEAAFNAAMRDNAAATAAHGHRPGDACPICARPLPKAWIAPIAPGLDAAATAQAGARATHVAAEREAREAESQATKTEQRAALSIEQVTLAERALDRGAENLKALLPAFEPGLGPAAIIRRLEAQSVEAADQAHIQVQASDEAKAAETRTRTSIDERESAVTRRSSALAADLAEVDADKAHVAAELDALPATLALARPPMPEDFERAIGELETLEADAETRQANLARAQAEQKAAADAIRVIERRRRDEVDIPEAQYRESLGRLAAAIERAETYLGVSEETGLEGAGKAAFEARASAVAEALAQRAKASEVQLARIAVEQKRLLSAHDMSRREEVIERARVAADGRAVSAADLDRAERQIPEAAALDRKIEEGGSLIDALAELARLLGDGQFIGYVVDARQRSLLGIASTILDDMSGGRYGFSDGFQIVDRTSGQPRSTKTLSGGETFQASLALALGLVELAGRSGGRLSALFLDEGFGTLDANALDEALEELERRAASGRVIGVISHLRSVADRIEHVLRVDKELGRTQVRWINDRERQRLNAEDLSHAGLTA